MAKNTFDYNRDNQVDAADQQLADMDTDGNRRVSKSERDKYYQKQGKTVTKYDYDAEGNIIREKTTGGSPPAEQDISAADLGYVPAFLKGKPEIRDAIARAIKYNWTEQQFINFVERETVYGKTHTAAQELFDMRSVDPAYQKDYEVSLNRQKDAILQAARTAGVSVTDQEAADFAKRFVRNGLDESAIRMFIGRKFEMPQPTSADGSQETTPLAGDASVISSRIKDYADVYGITLTDVQIGNMVKEGLKQPNVDQWLAGKENVFRTQAKTIYGSISDLLDTMTTKEVLSPYIGIAAQTLGLNANSLKVNDPRWTKAFQGENGPMSNEEWVRTLKTDKTYGYSKTQAAKVEASQIARDILSVLGG